MKFKPVQILYFVDGSAPTNADIIAASKINAHVMYRNARAVPAEGALEVCDGVAGKVPPRYAKAFPTAETAVKARMKELDAMASKIGDSPAPASPPAPPAPASDTDPATQAATAVVDAGGAGDATDDASKPAPGAAPAGSVGAAWKAN